MSGAGLPQGSVHSTAFLSNAQRSALMEVRDVADAHKLYSVLWQKAHPLAEVMHGVFLQLADEAATDMGFHATTSR